MKFATLLSVVLKELSFKKKNHFFFFLNLMLPWQTNKMVTGHKTHELGRQSSNDHNCQIWFISLWEFSVAMATKPKGRLADFYLFSISLTPLTFAPNYSPTASVVLE